MDLKSAVLSSTHSVKYGVMVFNATFNNISVISFIGRGNPSTWRKLLTCHKSLTGLKYEIQLPLKITTKKFWVMNSNLTKLFKIFFLQNL